jgi:threonine synthase
MDIQAASNFERYLYYMLGGDQNRVRETMVRMKSGARVTLPRTQSSFRSTRMDDETIAQVIAQVWKDWHYVIDPHTACAFTGMAQDRVSVVLSTASPAKFPEVVQAATGSEPTHTSLEALKSKPLQTYPLEATAEAVKAFLRSKVG